MATEQTSTDIEIDVDLDAPVSNKTREPTPYERQLRQEAARYRQKAKGLEQSTEAKVMQVRTEMEAKLADVGKAAEQRLLRAELKSAALAAGMVDLDALKLLDLSKVKLAEDGTVEGADALMTEAKKAKPYLFGATATTSSTQPEPKSAPAAEKAVKDMTKAEFAALRAKLSAL